MAASSSETSSSSSGSNSRSRRDKKRSHSHHKHSHKSSHHGKKRTSKEKKSKKHHHHHHHRKSRSSSDSGSSTTSSSSNSSPPKGKSELSKKHKATSGSKPKKAKEGKQHGGDSKLGYQYGKYGIIQDTDLYVKREEFHAWLMDVKKINPESLSQSDLKKHFSAFVEDYNLGILPGEKYYHLLQWEREQDFKKQKKELQEQEQQQEQQQPGQSSSPSKRHGRPGAGGVLRGEITRMQEIAKEWAMASQEPDTFLQNDEELRRLEQKREIEERKRAEFQAQQEITNLERLARESEAMIKTLHQSRSK